MKKQSSFLGIILVLILGITIGYASLTSLLNINGSTHISGASWDIHFDNIVVKEGSVTATKEATIDSPTTVSYSISLDAMKEYYEFNVDVINDGTLDAILGDNPVLEGITSDNKYLDYKVTYSDGTEIKKDDALNSGEKKTLTVRVEYKDLTDEEDLPSKDTNLNLKFIMDYIQKQ